MLPSKREASARSEDLFPLTFCNRRRTERSVQTCGRQNALSSALYSRRVARLQDQLDRLQQRSLEDEEEHRLARQNFQGRLQQLHESWQDCFDRHQHAWSREKAQAESAWEEERHHLQTQVMQLTSALTGQSSKELMEDAAVQAGSMSGKSRSSQTPRPTTPRPTPNPTRSTGDGVWDLLRTQSLPPNCQEWLGALTSSEDTMAEFGNAAAEYALKVAEGSLSDGDYSQAASSFATAAALYAKGMSESAPATADSFLSSSSSDTSEDTTLAQFFPLHETAGKPDKAPVPDQSWWEEFGEWECASKVSHLPAHVTSPTQPRLVCGDHIVRLPIVRSDARLPYASFTGLLDAAAPTVSITHAIHQHDAVKTPASAVKPVAKEAYAPVIYSKWELLQDSDEDSDQVFRYTPPHFTCCTYRAGADDTLQATAAADVAAQQFKVKQAVGPNTPTFTGSIFTPQESLADNDNIWGGIQPCAGVTVKSEQPHSKSACEEVEELHSDLGHQQLMFPSPSSAPWGLQESEGSPVTLTLPRNRFRSSSSNPWGLQESAFPIMDISLAKHAFEADVTYTPVEAFQPLPTTPTAQAVADSNIFSSATGCPISFSSSFLADSSSHVEVMDMSAGDLVSLGGPDSCPWDGTSSVTQHSTPSFPKSSMEERFAADLRADSTAQQEHVVVQNSSLASAAERAQVVPSEQALLMGAVPPEQSMQSRRAVNTNPLLSAHSVGRKATLDELAGLLLPQSCRVAARVSTKLPPLDHDPMLPTLPEGFILPPEMHPVVGTYRTAKRATSSTASQTAAAPATAHAASKQSVKATSERARHSAARADLQEEEQAGGKWLHPKLPSPCPRARVVGDLADQAAASMNMTTQELLAASPMTELLKDVLSYCPYQQHHDIDLPTFSSRLADSGFMTCQLAQILAPIRAASAPLVSSDDAPATPPKSSANGSSQRQPQQAADHMFVAPAVTPAVTRFEPSMTAAAVADPAQEARLEAAAEGLLAEIGIDCSSQTMTRADSDACSEFEMVPAAAADMDTKISAKGLDAGQWLGPAVQLVKTTSATLDSASYDIPDSAESAAFYSPRLQSASEPEFALVAMHDVRTSSTVSVGDVRLETAGDDSRMTEQARQPAAVCAAAIDNGSETGFGESASGSGSDSDSVLSLVSASSFGDEEMVDDLESPEEWEMI